MTTNTKRTLTVATEVGTFSRTTAHDYTHVVVCKRDDGTWGTIGWSGRLKLAQRLQQTWTPHFAELRTYALDGTREQ